jgi:hypothetical protein
MKWSDFCCIAHFFAVFDPTSARTTAPRSISSLNYQSIGTSRDKLNGLFGSRRAAL